MKPEEEGKDHKAVAVRYQWGEKAPWIAAKGRNNQAERIKSLAKAHNIDIIDKGELAEALYILPVNEMIPEELFPVMAEILAFALDKGSEDE